MYIFPRLWFHGYFYLAWSLSFNAGLQDQMFLDFSPSMLPLHVQTAFHETRQIFNMASATCRISYWNSCNIFYLIYQLSCEKDLLGFSQTPLEMCGSLYSSIRWLYLSSSTVHTLIQFVWSKIPSFHETSATLLFMLHPLLHCIYCTWENITTKKDWRFFIWKPILKSGIKSRCPHLITFGWRKKVVWTRGRWRGGRSLPIKSNKTVYGCPLLNHVNLCLCADVEKCCGQWQKWKGSKHDYSTICMKPVEANAT